MEEVGTQVASPLLIHQNIGGRFFDGSLIGKKRSLGFSTINYLQQQQSHNLNPGDGWNPKEWEWDSTKFVARARHLQPDLLCLGSVAPHPMNHEGGDLIPRAPITSKSTNSHDIDEDDGGSLQLQLGGVGGGNVTGSDPQNSNSVEDPASLKPNKKVRSGSPGGGAHCAICQVDDCQEDLSKSKDYHRRHKVCEVHSKATKALVGRQMQRFCQQCSRFHPLSEFDEGKRSCRRRLAGHNRRRRKTQTDGATSPPMHPPDSNNVGNGNLDIVNLFTVLARGQGNAEANSPTCPSLPDKNQLIEILKKMSSLPTDTGARPFIPTSSPKNAIEQGAFGQSKLDLNTNSMSTTDLLAVLSATLAAKPGSDACKKPTLDIQSLGGERSSSSCQSPTEDSHCKMQDADLNLPLQLFGSSSGDDQPPNLTSSRKYFSSNSSNPTEEGSPSLSPPVTRKLFPLETTLGNSKADRISFNGEANISLELFSMGNRAVSNSVQGLPCQEGCTFSSGSDHSPPSFNSDPQKDRTGRIIFKLFDKDPSHFPGELRAQIYNWLSNSPSDIESYIRPGCVVLSVYVSMSSAAWGKLEENLLRQVSALVQGSNSEFWKSGRFSVNIGSQLVVHKDGKTRICRPWSTLSSPELIVVSPLAVVSGQDTSLMLRGRNLTSPGTKIHCAYMGGYASKEFLGSSYEGSMYDEIKMIDFKVHATSPSVIGRCFIEVENGVIGNSFPVIIADAKICQELRLLEYELNEEAKVYDVVSDDQVENIGSSTPSSRDEVLHFLNELGWLFQRQRSSVIDLFDYMLHRFQFVLTFSVERDYCALVKKLLDIFLEGDAWIDGLSTEYVEALENMHILHRAVKRRSKKMVDLLIHYSIPYGDGTSKKYIFPPNLRGPGGITPLHLAACTSGSYDIVDVLIDDPMQIGLNCWNSLLDDNGQSPFAYASMTNNHSSNNLVARKLADRRNGQVSVSIGNEILESTELRQRAGLEINRGQNSCSKCAMMTYSRTTRSQGLLHRPFIHSMLGIAAVCVCVCLLFKSLHINSLAPFMWENLDFGSI